MRFFTLSVYRVWLGSVGRATTGRTPDFGKSYNVEENEKYKEIINTSNSYIDRILAADILLVASDNLPVKYKCIV